ncbi:MAG: T9SS type A sorting domain-containing protein [Bacteroidales bacterium]|nr:T9SS type A sorting domain-containing protein [Bacteroidales bacterium]
MRKHILTTLLIMLTVVTFGQQWVAIKSDAPSTIQTTLVASSENQITVNMQVPGFYTFEVTTPRGEANIISVPRTVSTAAAGEPNLPMIAVPAIVGDRQHYGIRVIDAQYTDFQMEVAPSKGDFPRSVNPDDVPYTYGEAYSTDAFFPAQNVGLYDPYILRDFRGQNMVVYPFAYNPISKTLRVYYNMTVEMYADGQQGENIIDRRSTTVTMDPEIKTMYEHQFINFSEGLSKYTPMVETGDLLIICHDAFMSAMQPFVNWKKQIGRPTTMVGTSTAGTTTTAIQTYIQNQYNANPNLTHVLLVGDVGQIPGINFTAGSGYYGYSGKSDNMYGQVVGNDLYNDIIIGRFSAETEAHVTTQVNKVIHYERDMAASDTWLPTGTGVATVAGSGGHFGEDDWQHIDNIRTDLLAYNYTEVYRDYPSGGGANSNSATLSQHINNGVSIINYCNHGSETSWGVFNYSNSNVNALTNTNKLPIVWSVACLNGKYDHSQPCFGETWLRATNGNVNNPDPTQPTGAIGGMFSYISQPWVPPMYGQDEMVDVLVESYSSNIKRTLGGISYDGNMKILDQYGQNDNASKGTYLAWILFGDPTLTVRNAVPQNMNVTHASTMSTNATSFMVNATNGNGALATLTRNNEIMGSATINNGVANITFTAPGTTGTATLTVFGYNKITYIATINITGGGTQYYNVSVMANPTNGGTVSGDGAYQLGQSCTVTATPNAGYTFVNWMENGNVVSTNAVYTFNVTGNHYLTANFQAQPQNYTVSVSANPTNGGTVSGGGTYQQGQSCTVTATPATGFTFLRWTENGSQVSTNASYTFTVTGNRTLVAQFQALPQNYTISVSANPTNGGTVSGGGTYQQGQQCTVHATANTGYTFTNWTENGNVVSTNANYSFTVTSNRTLVANFTAQTYTITATANPTNGGTVAGGGTFNYGQSCTLTATPATGYNFVRWTKNGLQVSTNANYTFNVTESAALVAQFQLQSCAVFTSAYPVEGGTTTGGGSYLYGDNVTVTATANEGYNFINWVEDDNVVSTEANYSFTVTGSRSLTAIFELQALEITVAIDPEEAGTIIGGGTYSYGEEVTLTIERNEDWAFQNWTENGEVVSEEMTYTFVITSNRDLVAHFMHTEGIDEQTANVSLYPNPTQGEVTLEGEGLQSIRIMNAFGQTIYNAKVEGNHVRIDLSGMAKGIYVMHIGTENGNAVRQIVVE